MSEEHNQREIFEGRVQRGPDRRAAPRRKSDYLFILLKYASVALVAALLVKYLG